MTCDTVLLLTGPDRPAVEAARAVFLADHANLARERIDLSEHGVGRLLEACTAGGLFGSARLVDVVGGDELNAEAARALAAAADGTDARVVIRGGAGKPHRAVTTALTAVGTCHHFAVPSARALPGRIRELAAARQVQLDGACVSLLVDRAGHDLERVDGVLRLLAGGGIARPQARQVGLLLGSTAAPGVPWQVTDAVERGDPGAALDALDGVDPQALLAFLARRLLELGRLAEAGASTEQQAAGVLGGPAWRARAALAPAATLGAAGAAAALRDVVATTAAARGDVAAAQVDDLVAALLVRLAGRFTR